MRSHRRYRSSQPLPNCHSSLQNHNRKEFLRHGKHRSSNPSTNRKRESELMFCDLYRPASLSLTTPADMRQCMAHQCGPSSRRLRCLGPGSKCVPLLLALAAKQCGDD